MKPISALIQHNCLWKVFKRHHLNRAGIPKLKTEDDVEVPQNAETIDKVPISNIYIYIYPHVFPPHWIIGF